MNWFSHIIIQGSLLVREHIIWLGASLTGLLMMRYGFVLLRIITQLCEKLPNSLIVIIRGLITLVIGSLLIRFLPFYINKIFLLFNDLTLFPVVLLVFLVMSWLTKYKH